MSLPDRRHGCHGWGLLGPGSWRRILLLSLQERGTGAPIGGATRAGTSVLAETVATAPAVSPRPLTSTPQLWTHRPWSAAFFLVQT
jgi:hypothetical protein